MNLQTLNAYIHFHSLIVTAANKDAALSRFDRQRRAGAYTETEVKEIQKLFEPIRQERINRRAKIDIGQVADQNIYKWKTVEVYIAKARAILYNPQKVEEVILALLLLTGRRTAEVCGVTIFQEERVMNLAKGGRKSIKARYLATWPTIKKGIDFLTENHARGFPTASINRTFAMALSRRIGILFPGAGNVHNLRKLYTAYWVFKCSEHIGANNPEKLGTFINELLGHRNPLSALPYLKNRIEP